MLRLRDFLTRRGDPLQLEALTGELGLDRQLPDAEVASPGPRPGGIYGTLRAGAAPRAGRDRDHLSPVAWTPHERRRRLEMFFGFDLPCIFVTKGQQVPQELLDLAQERSVPVLRSKLKTAEFYRRVKPIVEDAFAPRTTLHGSLADVYGVGLLFVGRSGIGKSECVLDLVERGHRLVADDVVQVTRRGHDVLIGKGHELAAHHMEIRGIGLIDIPALFGVRAVRQQKRIEVIVQLEDWETAKDADRTGLARQETLILEVAVPKVVVPLNPGQEHHGDLRGRGDEPPAPLLGDRHGGGVQRAPDPADEGEERHSGVPPGRL